jgi:F-type H+-transporting ATPase subunit b
MKYLIFLFLQAPVLAAGGAAAGHLSDLIVPAINFTIVFGFIFWKAKGPISRMFDENSVKVKELVELAQKRDKEAQIKLDMYQKKMSGVQSEIDGIIKAAESDAQLFETEYVKEVEANMEKMIKDSEHKLESEKNNMIKMLNASLLDEVISKAKNKLSSDKSLNSKTTTNILSKL